MFLGSRSHARFPDRQSQLSNRTVAANVLIDRHRCMQDGVIDLIVAFQPGMPYGAKPRFDCAVNESDCVGVTSIPQIQ